MLLHQVLCSQHILLLAIAIRLLTDPRIRPRYRPFGCLLPFYHIKCHLLPAGCSPRAFCYLPFSLAPFWPCRPSTAVLFTPKCHYFTTRCRLITTNIPAIGIWPLFLLFRHTKFYFATSMSPVGINQAGPPRGCYKWLINTERPQALTVWHDHALVTSACSDHNEDTLDAGHLQGWHCWVIIPKQRVLDLARRVMNS